MGKGRTERVGQLLVVAAGAAQALATERLEPLGLSPRAWGVISTLVESGPQTQIELATATATDRTAMVYLLDELESRGLVERMPNPDDRRSYLIHLTAQGRKTQRKAAAGLANQADSPELREKLLNLARAWMHAVMDVEDAASAKEGQWSKAPKQRSSGGSDLLMSTEPN